MSYPDVPAESPSALGAIAFQSGDVLMVVNQFGLRSQPDYGSLRSRGVQVIEDHTHAPWSKWATSSTADYGLASLRKVLPIPDGGVLWSPMGQPLPSQVEMTTTHERAAHQKVAAMALKSEYLAGGADCKSVYRALAIAGEERMCAHEVSGMSAYSESLMASFPVSAWRRIRVANRQTLRDAIGEIPGVTSLGGPHSADVMSFILMCRTQTERDALRSHLMQNRIYAAILWNLDVESPVEISPESCSFGRRMLSIHCDMRYSRNDMMRVGDVVRRFFDSL
ncbi:MAG: hypothetical protein GWP91_15040 [Rhodobacterales bacterium]|nr:hypothetical protein [Rhodobacterales bacterium]